jgi:hypothetical protein
MALCCRALYGQARTVRPERFSQYERYHPSLRRSVDLLHVDRLDVDKLLDAVVRQLAPIAAGFDAAKRQTGAAFTRALTKQPLRPARGLLARFLPSPSATTAFGLS